MERACDVCGQTYTAKRPASRYCGSTCRQRSRRAGTAEPAAPVHIRPMVSGVADATRAELVAAGRLHSSAGQRAMVLAELIDARPQGSFNSLAAWSREHGAAMEQALKSASSATSSLDELKARRSAKRGA